MFIQYSKEVTINDPLPSCYWVSSLGLNDNSIGEKVTVMLVDSLVRNIKLNIFHLEYNDRMASKCWLAMLKYVLAWAVSTPIFYVHHWRLMKQGRKWLLKGASSCGSMLEIPPSLLVLCIKLLYGLEMTQIGLMQISFDVMKCLFPSQGFLSLGLILSIKLFSPGLTYAAESKVMPHEKKKRSCFKQRSLLLKAD